MKKGIALLAVLALIASAAFASGSQEASSDGGVKPLTILFSSTFAETETGGALLKHFAENLGEISDGKIRVNIKYGGTLYGNDDQLEAVSSGAVQMIALGHNPHFATLPILCSVPDFAPDNSENALNYFKHILFEDSDSSAAVQAEAEKNGIKYLNVIAGGANAFCANFAFTDLASMAKGSSSFGNMEAAKFESLGFRVTQMLPWDMYDFFDRGVVDATQMGFAPMISMSIYEVADYWMLDNTYTAGNFLTVNLAWWDSLSADQQALIQQAADEVMAYSATIYESAIADEVQLLKDKGCTVVEMSDSDFDTWWNAVFMSKVDMSLKTAEERGLDAEIKAALKAAAEFTNYNISF